MADEHINGYNQLSKTLKDKIRPLVFDIDQHLQKIFWAGVELDIALTGFFATAFE